MPVTHTWDVQRIENYPTTQNQVGITTNAYWTAVATDGTRSASAAGFVDITGSVNTGQFTPFESLTELQVLAWVYSALGDEKAWVEEFLVGRIDLLANPPDVRNGVPW